MKRDLVIFGTANFGTLAQFYFERDSDYRVVAYTAHAEHVRSSEFNGLPLVPFEELERHYPPDSVSMFVAIGYRKMNRIRASVYDQAKGRGYALATYVSSRCTNWSPDAIGDNCFIFEDNTIQPFVTIGNDVVLWSGNHVGHHSAIADHCFLSSHVVVSGFVTVQPYCFLGVNATIRDGVTIGEGSLIGAGSIIMKSTAPREVYIPQRTMPVRLKSDEIDI